MHIDVMTGGGTWSEMAELAQIVERANFSGLLFTETSQTPWMAMTVAAQSAPSLHLCTGIAVAFARSPMVSAAMAWELAENTQGKFRLGLGSQVRAHVERRYGADFDPPGPRLRDYVGAVRDCFGAFNRTKPLDHRGPYYELTLLPDAWTPAPHAYGDIKVDISAVGPWMTKMAGEAADGVHVHPLHSMTYINQRLLPAIAEGAAAVGRDADEVDLIIPVFAVPGDSEDELAPGLAVARRQIAFYGATKNYAFQFDDLGFDGTSARLNELLKAGDINGMADTITDDMLDHFAVVAPWDEMAPRLIERYGGVAERVVLYQAAEPLRRDPAVASKWAAVAQEVQAHG